MSWLYSCHVIINGARTWCVPLSSSLYSSNALEYVPLITHHQSSWHKNFPFMIRTVLAFLYTTYTRDFYAKRFSIKASLGYQQGNVGIKFCHYTARNVWHKIFPLYSKAKTVVLCHVLCDPARQCHAVGDVVLQTWSCRLSKGWATIMKLQTAHRKLHTAITVQKLWSIPHKSCLWTHNLHVTAWRSNDETTLNLIFMVLIIYSQQVSIFMKQPILVFVAEKKAKQNKKQNKKGVVELTTLPL